MSLEAFLRRVAQRERAGADGEARDQGQEGPDRETPDEAILSGPVFEHARAVFATLSEAVSRKEWFDIVVELSEDYRPLMPAGIA